MHLVPKEVGYSRTRTRIGNTNYTIAGQTCHLSAWSSCAEKTGSRREAESFGGSCIYPSSLRLLGD